MQKTCVSCGRSFEIRNSDLKFYDDISLVFNGKKYPVPLPIQCPDCRMRRRMAWCNEQNLYHNTCALTGKPVISQLPAGNPRTVWNINDWWSDKFDPLAYGREIDLSRSILDQLHELELSIPHPCINTDFENENSEYTHHAGHEKNCYLMFHTSYAEDCYYGYGVKQAKSCTDNYYCHESELCYECIDVKKCYDLGWCQECVNCSSSRFLRDCIGCSNCLLCTGLRNKKFCLNNQQLSEKDYKDHLSKLDFGSYSVIENLKKEFKKLELYHQYKHLRNELTENCFGDHLIRARDCYLCFNCSDIEQCAYCAQLQLGAKTCFDIYQFGIGIERCYECSMIGYNIYNCHFCYDLLEQCHNLFYCLSCFSSSDSFACFGLKKNKYCILNKQYTREEYEQLVPKIIEKMQADGEWGEFFPVSMSQSAYNETSAQLWYPLSKEEVLKRGWNWQEEEKEEQQYLGPKVRIPDNINDVNEDICKHILVCEATGKPFKIIPQELKFYKQIKVPVPRLSFLQRHKNRFNKRNPRKMWQRKCNACQKLIFSTFDSERPEKILCESCYYSSIV